MAMPNIECMPYEVIIPDKIQHIIDKKLDRHLKERLYKKLMKLKNEPHSYAKPLRHPLAGVWEIYFEKRWRLLFEIHDNDKTIVIIGFMHKDEMS